MPRISPLTLVMPCCALIVSCVSGFAQQMQPALSAAEYAHAESFMGYNTSPLVFGAGVRPGFVAESDRFWYRVARETGAEFVLFDPATGVKAPAFDHALLAAALSTVSGENYQPGKL